MRPYAIILTYIFALRRIKGVFMIRSSRLWKVTVSLYLTALVFFLLFFCYMMFFENVKTETTRVPTINRAVEHYTHERISDNAAPAGVRNVYRFTMDTDIEECSIFCFYTVHQYADVYFGDEKVYSLSADAKNRIGKTISSNWVIVPIHRHDIGKDVTVVLTPLFESMIDYDVDFQLGSYYSSIYRQLKADLPQLFISLLCIFNGLVIITVCIYFLWRMKTPSWDIFFLGSFSLVLGLWRITDTMSSPLLFTDNPMALGYITIGSLFLCCAPLLLLMSTLYSKKKQRLLLELAIGMSVVSIVVVCLQALGIFEFKQMLPLSHVMMISAVLIVILMSAMSHKDNTASALYRTGKYFIIVAAGIILDIACYYVTESSSSVMFTMIAFIVYELILFLTYFVATIQKAHLDARTGLFNKARWNEIVSSHAPSAEEIGFIMIDMNALKWINDNFGHETGDRIIFNFANIIRNVFPSSCTISLWGGDEFSVMTLNMKKETIEFYLGQLKLQVAKHNDSTTDPPIQYAAGYVLSGDYPDKDNFALIDLADKRMYENKNLWYDEHPDMKKIRREA